MKEITREEAELLYKLGANIFWRYSDESSLSRRKARLHEDNFEMVINPSRMGWEKVLYLDDQDPTEE